MTKKIVVTGIGATSPLGGTARDSWNALLAGESGARTLEHEWVAELRAARHLRRDRRRCAPKRCSSATRSSASTRRASSRSSPAREAWADAGAPEVAPERLGVDYSTGIGGLWTLLDAWDTLREKGPRRVLPMTVPMLMPNGRGRRDQHGPRTPAPAPAPTSRPAPRAPRRSRTPTTTCSRASPTSSSPAAPRRRSTRCPSPRSRRCRRSPSATTTRRPPRAPTTSTATASSSARAPPRSSLETEEHAKARGARIYAELAGGAVTSDSYHITAPDPEGSGAARAMIAALEQARARRLDDVTHINAHATSTPGRRHRRVQRAAPRLRRRASTASPSRRRRPRPGTCSAAPARSRRSSRCSRCTSAPRRPTINLTEQDPEIPLDVVTSPRALGDGDRARDQQLVRLRRPQRGRRVPHRLSGTPRGARARRDRPRSPRGAGVFSSRPVGFGRATPGWVIRRSRRRHRAGRVALSRPGAARRPGRHRWRGGRARARRPRPGRARAAARGAARARRAPATSIA